MAIENGPFEDVFPIEHGDFPLLCYIRSLPEGIYTTSLRPVIFWFGVEKKHHRNLPSFLGSPETSSIPCERGLLVDLRILFFGDLYRYIPN